MAIAKNLIMTGRYHEAIPIYNMLITNNPDNAIADLLNKSDSER